MKTITYVIGFKNILKYLFFRVALVPLLLTLDHVKLYNLPRDVTLAKILIFC